MLESNICTSFQGKALLKLPCVTRTGTEPKGRFLFVIIEPVPLNYYNIKLGLAGCQAEVFYLPFIFSLHCLFKGFVKDTVISSTKILKQALLSFSKDHP